MRNLKRALSLTLASVMLLGMMVVGTSALSFNDADDISNVTAASVLEDLGIMQGDGSGNFMPDKAVTRAQMAIIVCRILYGNKLNVSQFEGTTQYTDVGANDYYTGYINLATQLGIIGGYGDGRFGPNDTVTTAQAALMLSRALGYFKGNEIAQASDWALASIAQASKIKMFGNLNLSTNAELARDNVAEMVFNTITKTVPVQYNELLGVYYNENKGIIYALTFYYTDTLGYKNFGLVYRSNDTTDYGRPGTTWGTGSYRLGNSGEGNTGSDAYGLNEDGSLRPDRVKMLSQDEIITVAYEPDYIYTGNTKQDKVYKDLGSSLCKTNSAYSWSYYVDGDLKNGYTTRPIDDDENWLIEGSSLTAERFSGDGATTEIYIDSVNETVRVVTIWNYMAEVLRAREDEDGRYIDVRVGNCEYSLDNEYYTADFAEDDFVIVNIDNEDRNSASNSGDYFIQDVYETGKVEGTVREVRKWLDSDKDNDGDWVRLEDTEKHVYSRLTWDDVDDINSNHPDLDAEYRLYLDPNGFVVGFQALEDISRNYLYVTDTHDNMGIQAKVVFADGTSARVDVDDEFTNYKANVTTDAEGGADFNGNSTENNVYAYNKNDKNKPDGADPDEDNKVTEDKLMKDGYSHLIGVDAADSGKPDETLNQRVFRYSKDKNGVYTLTQLSDNRASLIFSQDDDRTDGDKSIVNGAAYITVENTEGNERYIVDKKTAFVDVKDKTLYTGYEEVPNYLDADFYVVDVRNDRVADVVFIIDGERYNDNSTYFYVNANNPFSTYKDDKYGYDVSLFPAKNTYVDGVKQDVEVDYNKCILTDQFDGIGLYKIVRENDDGVATQIEKVNITTYGAIAAGVQSLYTNAYTDKPNGKPADSQWVINNDTVFVIISGDKMDKVSVVTGSAGARYIIDDTDIKLNKDTKRTYVSVIKDDTDKNLAKLVYVVEYELSSDLGNLTGVFTGMNASGFYVNGKSATNLNGLKAGDKIEFTLTPELGYDLPKSIKINGTNVPVDPETGKVSYTVPSSGEVEIPEDQTAVPQTTTVEWTAPEAAEGSFTVKVGDKALESGAEVGTGDKLVITAEPAAGKQVKAVKVNGETVTANEDSTYTYTVQASDIGANKKVTVAVEFEAAAVDTRITVALKNPDGTDATVTKQQFNANGDLVVEFTIPDGAVLKTSAMNKADITVGGDFYANLTVTTTATGKATIAANTLSAAGVPTEGEIEVDLKTIVIDNYSVEVIAPAGWLVVKGEGTSSELSTETAGNLKVTLKPKDTTGYGGTIKAKCTITGIDGVTDPKEVQALYDYSTHTLALENILGAEDGNKKTASGKVTITVAITEPVRVVKAVWSKKSVVVVEGQEAQELDALTLTFSAPIKAGKTNGTGITGDVNGKFSKQTLSEDGLELTMVYGGFGDKLPTTHIYSWTGGGWWAKDGENVPVVDTQISKTGEIRACTANTHTQPTVQNPSTAQQNNAG